MVSLAPYTPLPSPNHKHSSFRVCCSGGGTALHRERMYKKTAVLQRNCIHFLCFNSICVVQHDCEFLCCRLLRKLLLHIAISLNLVVNSHATHF
ncbi:hypothetical protein PAHAL_1G250200 [Panicum hallii]|uniref:Uncharacterized protein n=1 Tax=Panicum hallii TaxID=206008 RepID=A0A2S3GQ36_9POAL|nr:hypothetical protein PAHAL_1G250200 [Panicum hallii]